MKIKDINDLQAVEQAVSYAAHKAAPLFQMYGWTYGLDGGTRIPTVNELEDTINSLIDSVVDEGYEYSATGRFQVRKEHDGDMEYLSISLDLADVYTKE